MEQGVRGVNSKPRGGGPRGLERGGGWQWTEGGEEVVSDLVLTLACRNFIARCQVPVV